MKRESIRGVTLTELLIAIVILTILGGLSIVGFGVVKRKARVEEGKTYLRQQVMASWETVKNDRKLQVPCSPLYHWKRPCWENRKPMLGSSGYGLAVGLPLEQELAQGKVIPILLDPFAASYRLGDRDFMDMRDNLACARSLTFECEVPETLWFGYSDGSLRVRKRRPPPTTIQESVDYGAYRSLFFWPTMFELEWERAKKGSGSP
jgi:prepilin-type N-terminal cleavage/methylation domain-containing protein